jgi:type IV pilus assembly protein PilC
MSLRAVASPVLGGGFLLLLFIAAYSVRDLLIDFNGRMQVFLALEHRIANGAGLSEAMASLPRFFPRHLVCLVEAGETAGTLDPAFERFNAATLRSLGAQRELRATLSYLGLLAGVQLVVGMYLLVKVVPAFQEIRIEIAQSSGMADAAGDFVSSAGPVPAALLPSIGGLMEWSNGLYFSKPVASLILWPFITWVMFRHFNRARSWSARFSSSLLLMLPWFRGLIVRHNLGQVAFMLQGLLAAGVPLERALGMVGVADLHPAYLRWIGTLRARVCQGESLKEALRRTAPRGLLPESFVGLMEAGERSGQLPETLARIAELYRRDTEQRLGTLQALVLPAGILFLGYLVMATQVSIFRMMNDMAALLNV